jgi:competence protein ComEC
MTQYGLIANMVAIPVTAFWIMPWGVAALLLMPFGLEALALQPMAWGVEAILATARTVASWPGASVQLPPMPAWGLTIAAFGGLWLCLWQGRVRWAGIAGILAGIATIGLVEHPDILISGNGRLIAVRMTDGGYSLSSIRAERFQARLWLEATGGNEPRAWPDAVSADGRMSCDLTGCLYRAGGRTVALVQDPRALAEDCVPGAIVVSAVPARRACRAAARVIDRFDLWREGAHALWLKPGGVAVASVRQTRGERLWTHGPPRRRAPARGKDGGRTAAAGGGEGSVSIAGSGRPADPAP